MSDYSEIPKPNEDGRTLLRYRTLERILQHLEAAEIQEAKELVQACLDWDARKAEYGRLMKWYRKLVYESNGTPDPEQEAAYREALDRMP